jgi:hypothetical protein
MQALQSAKSLYQIREEHLSLIAAIEDADGELTPDIEEALQLTEEEFQDKAVSYSFVVKSFDTAADLIDAEIKRLKGLKEKSEKRAELFKTRLAEAMNEFGVESITTPLVKISFRKSESVEIENEELIPAEYIEIKAVESISKTRIKEALKEGVTVPGASLSKNRNLQIK